MAIRLGRALALATLSLGVAFCASDDDSVCEPGETSVCACPGGSIGMHTCRQDGDGYEACDCVNPDGGLGGTSGGAATGGAGAAAGSGGAATGGTGGGVGGADSSAGAGGQAAASGAAGTGAAAGTGGAAGSAGAGGGAAGSAGFAGDAGGSCPPNTATDVTQGSCDLVTQDCSAGLTCRVGPTDGGQYQSSCVDLGNGSKSLGDTCSSHAECAAKLSCALGKCTRPCCTLLGPQICGGAGQCDLIVQYGGGAAYVRVCTFSPPCTVWANDCPPGPESDCHIGSGNKFTCSFPAYDPDAGSTVGNPCVFLNDCADSQHCDYNGGSTGTCRWLCKVSSGGGAPDAGAVGGPPGQGGCEAGETCNAYSTPSWLGVCRP